MEARVRDEERKKNSLNVGVRFSAREFLRCGKTVMREFMRRECEAT